MVSIEVQLWYEVKFIQMLSIFVNEKRNDWDDHLPYLLMAYRATMHDSTGYTPHNIIFGRELICSSDIIAGFSLKNGAPRCPVQYVEWVNTIKLTYEFVN